MSNQSYRILIAEDFEDNRIALKLMLKLAGFEVLEAADGQQALDQVRNERPDLVLMDISLPMLDGLEATRSLRAEPEFERLPIIVVSAYDSPESHQEALDAGGTAYISKPIDFEELKQMIMTYLGTP
ncbi:MAG TPA: response regulator [Blastocatellia bacterium]|nr:response regulator [Blastocatellia bacterium]